MPETRYIETYKDGKLTKTTPYEVSDEELAREAERVPVEVGLEEEGTPVNDGLEEEEEKTSRKKIVARRSPKKGKRG